MTLVEELVVEDTGLDIMYSPERCNRCGLCLEVCPFNVWDLPDAGPAVIARGEDCTNCTSCAKNCLGSAITVRNIGCGCVWNEAARRRGACEESVVGPEETHGCSTPASSSSCG
ncbi:MAG: ferredoxin family protein [Candidatus Sifarchaeia archaeon]